MLVRPAMKSFFLPEGRPRSLRSLGLAMLNDTKKQINKQTSLVHKNVFFFFGTLCSYDPL